MTIEEILAGESKNVEFKETLPEKSIKYMKSVAAFAILTGNRGQNNDNNIKNGVNADADSIDGVENGASDIKNDVDEVAYTDKVFPDHIQKLLKIIAENPTETQAQYAEKLGISKRTISRIFAELKEQGILEQQGNRRKAKWLIIKKR